MIEIIRISGGRRLVETIDPWLLQLRVMPRDEHDHIVLPEMMVVAENEPVQPPRDRICKKLERDCRRVLLGVCRRRINTQQPRQRFGRESIRFRFAA